MRAETQPDRSPGQSGVERNDTLVFCGAVDSFNALKRQKSSHPFCCSCRAYLKNGTDTQGVASLYPGYDRIGPSARIG